MEVAMFDARRILALSGTREYQSRKFIHNIVCGKRRNQKDPAKFRNTQDGITGITSIITGQHD